jgi:hypothetical protein
MNRGTITCTEGREPSGLAMVSLSRVLGDVYRSSDQNLRRNRPLKSNTHLNMLREW